MSSVKLAGAVFDPMVGGILYDKTGVLGSAMLSASLMTVEFVLRLLVLENKLAALLEQNSTEDCGTITCPVELTESRGAKVEETDPSVSYESEQLLQVAACEIDCRASPVGRSA